MYSDNASSLTYAKNDSCHGAMKHIMLKWHLVRDCYVKKLVHPAWVSTVDQQADCLTKPLQRVLFLKGKQAVMNGDPEPLPAPPEFKRLQLATASQIAS